MTLQDLLSLLKSSGYGGSLDIMADKTFAENGLDSLDVFAWLAAIEEKYGVSVGDEEFSAINSPEDLVVFVKSRLH
jgi:acyl carrier protein